MRFLKAVVLAGLFVSLFVTFGLAMEKEKPEVEPAIEPEISEVEPSTRLAKLLDLGSTHCQQCKKMMPILDSLETAFAGRAEIIFVDVKNEKSAAREYGVTLIPTQIFFDTTGAEIYRHVGFFPADSLTFYLKKAGAKL